MAGDRVFLAAGVLLVVSVAAALAAARLRLPALLLFLAIGVAAGAGGADWISLHDYALAHEIGIPALALILFDGGLSTGFNGVKSVLGSSIRLAVGATVIDTRGVIVARMKGALKPGQYDDLIERLLR